MPIASLTTSETELREMEAGMAAGHITASPYFQSIDNDVNRRCVAKVKQRFGDDTVTDMCWEAAYFQTYLLASAFAVADSDNVQQLVRTLRGMEFGAPQGVVKIDADNHHAYLTPRIGRVRADGQFDILHEAKRPVKPDPYLVEHSLDDWSARVTLTQS